MSKSYDETFREPDPLKMKRDPKTGNISVVLEQSALDTQVAGSHYKDMPIQPVEFIYKNSIGYLEGNVIKYVARHRFKNGIEDVKKARHYCDLILELHYKESK